MISRQGPTGPELWAIEPERDRYAVAIDGRVTYAGPRAECERRLEILKRPGDRDRQDHQLSIAVAVMRALLVLCLLAGCAPVLPPAPPPGPGAFDFGPFVAPAGSSGAAPLGTAWLDYGGHQLVGHFRRPDGSAVAGWLYMPFTRFDPAEEAGCPLVAPCRGDGGEHYVIDPDGTLRIDSTQDGGTRGIQYFTGRDCGGTGWIVARRDIDASWHEVVATLADKASPVDCSTGSAALTRYTLRPVTVPNLGTRRAVISEHYNAATATRASAMERLFLLDGGVGRLWQAWGAAAPRPDADIAARCPDFGWNAPPVAGWQLEDCRENVFPQPTNLTGDGFWNPPQ